VAAALLAAAAAAAAAAGIGGRVDGRAAVTSPAPGKGHRTAAAAAEAAVGGDGPSSSPLPATQGSYSGSRALKWNRKKKD
jgi:hypothetical protein